MLIKSKLQLKVVSWNLHKFNESESHLFFCIIRLTRKSIIFLVFWIDLVHCAKVNRIGCRCLFSHNKSHLPPVYRMYRRDRSKEVHISHQVGGFYLTFGLPCNCAEVTFGFFLRNYAGHKSTMDENSQLYSNSYIWTGSAKIIQKSALCIINFSLDRLLKGCVL